MVYDWYTDGIRLVYGWFLAVYGGIRLVLCGIGWYTAGTVVVYDWYTAGIRLVYCWYTTGIRLVYDWYTTGIRLVYG